MKTKTIDAVIAGLTCLDFTPVFGNPPVEKVEDILAPTKTVIIGKAQMHAGGCVANTGLAMCKFGVNAALIGKIGKDAFGSTVLSEFQQYTSGEHMIFTEEGTAYTVVLAPKGIDRICLHYPAGNDSFCFDDIDYDLLEKSKLFHFGYPTIMKNFYQNNARELIRMYQKIKTLNVSTSMDTCAIDPYSEVGRMDWKSVLEELMPYLDIFTPSAEEICYMLDRERFESWKQRAGNAEICSLLCEEDLRPLADTLLSFGAKILMIKCGPKGIYFASAPKERMKDAGSDLASSFLDWADIRRFEPSFKPERILSSIGAGDVCIAAFLTSILKKLSLDEALSYAAAAGAACVESYDVLSRLSSLEALKDRILSGWERNPL
ncbi:MAG: carbohydrate kinase family protein [Johnsonella sp.]|nr:carbohydrate kinase family protein [Johnsonella sp.]